jgi:GrpB-like predicted nucleotidyltransferase (UPF0157 family)
MDQRNENTTQIVSTLKDFGLGLQRKTVEIVPYNKDWSEAFLWIKHRIEIQLGNSHAYQIEHIGSTSIPGMVAKPILDVMMTFKTEPELNDVIAGLEGLGFIYKGDMVSVLQQTEPDPGRHFFAFYDLDQKVDYAHLHMFTEDHPDSTHKIEFRNTLRKSRALVQEYIQLKRRLKSDNLERHEYTLRKGDFITNSAPAKCITPISVITCLYVSLLGLALRAVTRRSSRRTGAICVRMCICTAIESSPAWLAPSRLDAVATEPTKNMIKKYFI